MQHRKSASLIAFVVGLAVGCGSQGVSIRTLRADPSRYMDHNVVVRGRGMHRLTVPFLAGTVYLIDDGTGTLQLFWTFRSSR